MYIMIDFTVGTLADLVGFEGYLNTSTPFSLSEHKAVWKTSAAQYTTIDQYPDFSWSNVYDPSCVLPQFWNQDGTPILAPDIPANFTGCYDSEFDQYGDTEAFGSHPDWQRELSKFASVQDRLREWKPSVMEKLKVFGCLAVAMLDVDGIRIDKATQMTVAPLADWASTTRKCAVALGKSNFFIPGEITGPNDFGSIYLGRGRSKDMIPDTFTAYAVNASNSEYFIRGEGEQALDGAAFHYSIYRSLERFLGMDGNLTIGYDVPVDFVTAWNTMVTKNDFLNPSTGEFDPRHLYGVTNQDLFRWPSITNGTAKNALGSFIVSLLLPGIPLILQGEEQEMYIFDSTAANYLYGRQPMSSNLAWQAHGCYGGADSLGAEQYFNMPFNKSITGCKDDWNSLDHFDPTAPSRQVMSRFYQLREEYPALLDGYSLSQLANWTVWGALPGSNESSTEWGVRSVLRGPVGQQTLSGQRSNITVLLVYSNLNDSTTIASNCVAPEGAHFYTGWPAGESIRNLMYPYDLLPTVNSSQSYYDNDLAPYRGCVESYSIPPLSFAAYVPESAWVPAPPKLVGFGPGHDTRLALTTENGDWDFPIQLRFTDQMNCSSISEGLTLQARTAPFASQPRIDLDTVNCHEWYEPNPSTLVGAAPPVFEWAANVTSASDGVYMFSLTGATNVEGLAMGAVDHLIIRKGGLDNAIVFPNSSVASYDDDILNANDDGSDTFTIKHKAAGADLFRFSADFGKTWSTWRAYEAETVVNASTFDGEHSWDGQHIMVNYWSELLGSSAHMVHGDANWYGVGTRRVPGWAAKGEFNQWGYDKGLPYHLERTHNGSWELHTLQNWPVSLHLHPFIDLDNLFWGDVDGDGVLDRMAPTSQAANYVNLTAPAYPHLGYTLWVDEQTMKWHATPRGHVTVQIILVALLFLLSPLGGVLAVLIYHRAFYRVTHNQLGVMPEKHFFPALVRRSQASVTSSIDKKGEKIISSTKVKRRLPNFLPSYTSAEAGDGGAVKSWPDDLSVRRKVLIATFEYEIFGLNPQTKVKIGGLGVMSSLVGKSMTDTDLIWVVPKVGDIDYSPMIAAKSIEVRIFGKDYEVMVENWFSDNITYWVLDSPVFRAQTKADPYPARMDDLESGIMYSTWNQCIAEVIRRSPNISIYWQNDYHTTLAPLYLLPQVIPTCLSLHNAEFQGLWPLRTSSEQAEMAGLFNLPYSIIERYVQFGNVFNLLHCGATYISTHQNSTGVAGVSDMYGKRSWIRYPALWTLKHIDSLPNPDPSDIAALDETPLQAKKIGADANAELLRPEHRVNAQKWAGLREDPEADLLCFVGRWSKQKGVDLIADVMPSILEKYPRTQLIAIGPVVDLYGSFAAKKLARLMELYPGRVYSKPEFTALPPFIFSGAEFALIPSRDEPFGLVAVEFGRKGALGVGSRLGGLGLAPGWWFNVESDSTAHLISQFRIALKAALKSSKEQRAILRARAAVQRFPVLEWRQRTEDLHRRAVLASRQINRKNSIVWDGSQFNNNLPALAPQAPALITSPDEARAGVWTPAVPSPTRLGAPFTPSVLGWPVTLLRGSKTPRSPLTREDSWDSDLDTVTSSPTQFVTDSSSLGVGLALRGVENLDYFTRCDRPESSPPCGDSISVGFGRNEGSFLAKANHRFEVSHTNQLQPIDPFMDPEAAAAAAQAPFTSANSLPASPVYTPRRSRASSFARFSRTDAILEEGEYSPPPVPPMPLTLPTMPSPMMLSRIDAILDEKADSPLNVALANFTDSDGGVTRSFVEQMQRLSASNSTDSEYCIELYLMRQEKEYFGQIRRDKIKSARASHRSSSSSSLATLWSLTGGTTLAKTEAVKMSFSPTHFPRSSQQELTLRLPVMARNDSFFGPTDESNIGLSSSGNGEDDGELNARPTGAIGAPVPISTPIQVFLLRGIGGWPLYCIILALGQMLAASSFQLVLLGGSSIQSNQDLYVIGTVFFFATLGWYALYTFKPLRWTLSLPFAFYALAFFGVSLPIMSPVFQSWEIRHAITLTSTCLYAVASAAGFAFFAFNFGDEAGVQAEVWAFRACVVEGSQQAWAAVLWFWGFKMADHSANFVPSKYIICATLPLCILVSLLGTVAYLGLPDFYRHKPGHIPNFVATLFRRKLVLWFLVSQMLSLYWLSSLYGRNWSFLWQQNPLPTWQTALLAAFFFIAVWVGLLSTLATLARKHTWILPIFAVGLGAPRWCQILWGTSTVGLYLPWAGVAGPYLACALWLWLGVLDAVQGVGLGTMLLQTLSRVHVASTIALAQLLGSVVVVIARATAPDKAGPSNVFPNFGLWNPSDGLVGSGLDSWAFWLAGLCQVAIVVGYIYVFRGEQLSKP